MKRFTLLGMFILVFSAFSIGLSSSELIDPPPSEPPVSDDLPPAPEDAGDEGFGVRCC
jgi:hypothetical protein